MNHEQILMDIARRRADAEEKRSDAINREITRRDVYISQLRTEVTLAYVVVAVLVILDLMLLTKLIPMG